MIDKKQPIIVKKVSHGGHGHHGGAWKVAFADFAVAMMAFFMLMWLTAGTSDEEKAAISEYFNNPSLSEGMSTTAPASSAQGPGGPSSSLIQFSDVPETKRHDKDEDFKKEKVEVDESDKNRLMEEQHEKKMLDDLMENLKKAVDESDALAPYKDQLLIEITPEGLRILIVDKANRPMFDGGKADLKYYTVDILFELAKFIREVPNRISLTGHTDASQFRGREGYGNWELSADRANAARRVLEDGGVAATQVGRVVGLASSSLFDKADPLNPINRRISIIVMNKKTDEAISRGEGVIEQVLSDRDKAQKGGFDDVRQNVLGAGDINIDMDAGTGKVMGHGKHVDAPEKAKEIKPIGQPVKLPDFGSVDQKVDKAVGNPSLSAPVRSDESDFEELPMELL